MHLIEVTLRLLGSPHSASTFHPNDHCVLCMVFMAIVQNFLLPKHLFRTELHDFCPSTMRPVLGGESLFEPLRWPVFTAPPVLCTQR